MSGAPLPPTGAAVLRQVITTHRRDLAVASSLTAIHQGGEAMVPVLVGVVVDTAVTTGSVATLLLWLAVLALDFAVLSYSFRFGARAAERAGELAAHELRVQLTARVLDPGGGAERDRLSGELVNIATGDAKRVGTLNLTIPFGLAALAAVLVSAIALLTISLPLGLVVLLGAPPLLLVAHLASRPLERRTETEQERAAHASGVATDLVAGLRVLKGIGAEAAAVERYRRTSQDALVATLRAARAQAAQGGVVQVLTGVFIAVVALVGGRLAAVGEIGVGGLVAAVGLALFLLTPLSAVGWVTVELAQARASANRIAAVLAAPAAVRAGTTRPHGPVRGAVRLRGLAHGELPAVDVDIAPGELLGVVVPDPAVAGALLACLAREVEPAAGTVELDGVALTELEPDAARADLLVAAHDAHLFAGTLLDNVVPSGRDPAGLARALAAAAADEVATALPDGVHSSISEQGRSLSGGQRQRVALARALAADATVLVLHDPTTAVDTVTEARIAAAVREVRAGRTTLVVTTSPALLAVADRVVVLGPQGVRAVGRHAELVAVDGSYRETVLA